MITLPRVKLNQNNAPVDQTASSSLSLSTVISVNNSLQLHSYSGMSLASCLVRFAILARLSSLPRSDEAETLSRVEDKERADYVCRKKLVRRDGVGDDKKEQKGTLTKTVVQQRFSNMQTSGGRNSSHRGRLKIPI